MKEMKALDFKKMIGLEAGKGRKSHDHSHGGFHPILFPGYEESLIISTKCRILYLSEDITPQSANQLSSILLFLDSQNHEPITLHVNTRGGAVSGLAQIIDIMGMIKSPVRTVNIGRAYSAGSVILAAGDERYAFQHSKCMIHEVQATFPIPEDTSNNQKYFDFMKRYSDDTIVKLLAKHTGQTFQKVKEDCKNETFFDAQEMFDYGLVDTIIT